LLLTSGFSLLTFMDLLLTNKVALISGSSKGLGLAAAGALLDEGAKVTICGRGRDALAQAAAALGAAKARDILAVQADVATAEGAGRVVDQTVTHFGRLDILVNNVGKAGGGDIVSTSDEEW